MRAKTTSSSGTSTWNALIQQDTISIVRWARKRPWSRTGRFKRTSGKNTTHTLLWFWWSARGLRIAGNTWRILDSCRSEAPGHWRWGLKHAFICFLQFTPMAWTSCSNVSYLIKVRFEGWTQPWGKRRLDRPDEFISPTQNLASREKWNYTSPRIAMWLLPPPNADRTSSFAKYRWKTNITTSSVFQLIRAKKTLLHQGSWCLILLRPTGTDYRCSEWVVKPISPILWKICFMIFQAKLLIW